LRTAGLDTTEGIKQRKFLARGDSGYLSCHALRKTFLYFIMIENNDIDCDATAETEAELPTGG
jgi:hypothetical protein